MQEYLKTRGSRVFLCKITDRGWQKKHIGNLRKPDTVRIG